MNIITACTPGYTPELLRGNGYPSHYFGIIRSSEGKLLACPMDSTDDVSAETEFRQGCAENSFNPVVIVHVLHAAYNVYPEMQTIVNWALEAASSHTGEPYA